MHNRILAIRVMSLILLGSLASLATSAQINFINGNSRIPGSACHSGVAIAVADLNGDGLDDIFRMDQGYMLQVQKQRAAQNFVQVPGLAMEDGGSSAWSMMIGDINEDGYKDVFYGAFTIFMSKYNTGTSSYQSKTDIPNSSFFQQNMNCMDVDGDGDVDLFSCDDNYRSMIWLNNGAGVFTESNIINFDVTPDVSGDETTDDSGNYGSVWSDFDNDGDMDFYIAKCRQSSSSPTDPRRINVLFVNNGNGTYTENAAAHNLAIGAQSWTANFDDINNDGWFDVLVCNHDVNTMLMLNDGAGNFTDINVNNAANLNIGFLPLESKMVDFDNDGFLDIIITGTWGGSDLTRVFRNLGNNVFSPVPDAFPAFKDVQSFAVGDLNHDGRMDIYAGYAADYTTPTSTDDILWLNNTDNDNHFVTFNLKGHISNIDALGARVFIYGAWGVQTREVRAGESYGTCNTLNLHFGLGNAEIIDSVIIKWPSGSVTKLFDKPVDQFISVFEDQCVSPDNKISGSLVQCTPGEINTLSAAAGAGYTYLWNTGATTQSIQVNTSGEYSVQVTSGNCSSYSPVVKMLYNPDETPSIHVNGNIFSCEGEGPELQGPAGYSSYLWSNGLTTQNIQVTETGTYDVTIAGECQSWTSDPVNVSILAAAAEPIATGDFIAVPGNATLSATGNNLEWYGTATGGPLLGTGSNFVTPFISVNTNYYVQAVAESAGQTNNGGMQSHSGTAYSTANTTNAVTHFTVFEDCILKSLKVYTDSPGPRLIEVRTLSNVLVASALVNIPNTEALPDGTRIDLEFVLPAGSYKIMTNASTNTSTLGFAGPRLKRNATGASYPYNIAGVLNITGNDQGVSDSYYYFYDWEVKSHAARCESERVQALATVGYVNIDESEASNAMLIYPNPATTQINIRWTSGEMVNGNIKLLDITGKMVSMEDNVNLISGASKTIDVSYLAPGAYVMEVTNANQTERVKFVVQ